MFDDILCVIPARKGSKSIPRKSIQPLNGVPMVVYSIKHALEAGVPGKNIIVSSDDEDVLYLAKVWKVTPHRRPDNLCDDVASTESVMVDAVSSFSKLGCTSVLLLQPTSPIRFKGRVAQCLEAYKGEDCDSLITVAKMPNLFWRETYDPMLKRWSWVSTYTTPRPRKQDMIREDYQYFDCGNIYIVQSHILLNTYNRTGDKPLVYPISWLESFQIDYPDELELAGKILKTSGLRVHSAKKR